MRGACLVSSSSVGDEDGKREILKAWSHHSALLSPRFNNIVCRIAPKSRSANLAFYAAYNCVDALNCDKVRRNA